MVNPFQVPGTAPGSLEPLRPWLKLPHRDYYVKIDSLGERMAQFEQRVGYLADVPPLRRLSDRGELVVVTGETGFGMTSLVHWCADRFDTLTNGAVKRFDEAAFIIDHSRYPYRSSEVTSGESRVRAICLQTLHELRKKNKIACPDAWFSDLETRGYREVYEQLAFHAEEYGFTLIVILPSVSDFVEELEQYCFLARQCGKIVFLAESVEDRIKTYLEDEQQRGSEIIWLQVGPIRESDGNLLATDRIRRYPEGSVARVRPAELTGMVREMRKSGDTSIKRLTAALYGAWESHSGESPPGEVTGEELRAQLGRSSHPRWSFRLRAW